MYGGASDIYYSIGELPKNKRRPTEKEAIEAKQVRYYGLKPIKDIKAAQFTQKGLRALEIKLTNLMIKIKHEKQVLKYSKEGTKEYKNCVKRLNNALKKQEVIREEYREYKKSLESLQ